MNGMQLVALDRAELARVAPNYEAMRQAIDLCQRIDEIAELANKAVAIQAYYRQSLDVENEMDSARVRLRAERRLGQLLKIMAANGERATQTHGGANVPTLLRDATPTLDDLGIPRDRASRAMQLANIPLGAQRTSWFFTCPYASLVGTIVTCRIFTRW
jgi:hypothetical protein